MAQTTVSDGIKMLVARHAATEGCEVGTKALATVKKISNADPSEGVWNKGDEFTVPGKMTYLARGHYKNNCHIQF